MKMGFVDLLRHCVAFIKAFLRFFVPLWQVVCFIVETTPNPTAPGKRLDPAFGGTSNLLLQILERRGANNTKNYSLRLI